MSNSSIQSFENITLVTRFCLSNPNIYNCRFYAFRLINASYFSFHTFSVLYKTRFSRRVSGKESWYVPMRTSMTHIQEWTFTVIALNLNIGHAFIWLCFSRFSFSTTIYFTWNFLEGFMLKQLLGSKCACYWFCGLFNALNWCFLRILTRLALTQNNDEHKNTYATHVSTIVNCSSSTSNVELLCRVMFSKWSNSSSIHNHVIQSNVT